MTERPDSSPDPAVFADGSPDSVGRTGWDTFDSAFNSKMLWIFLWTCLSAFVIWLFWDVVSSVPLYAISSVFISLLWFNPICTWLTRQSTYIEVWEPKTNTLTTYRVGRKVLSELVRDGISNQVTSLTGNNRIFASHFSPSEGILSTTWVHGCDPWNYHIERRTLNRLTERVNEVLEDITVGEAMAQVEGRKKAREFMKSHYSDLDRLFGGDLEVVQDEEVPLP